MRRQMGVKKKNLADGWESYECEKRRRYKDCSGSVKVKNGQFRLGNPHSHTPNPALNEAYKVMTAMRPFYPYLVGSNLFVFVKF